METAAPTDLVDVVVVRHHVLLRVVANLFDAVVLLDEVRYFRAGESKLGGTEHSSIFSFDNSFNINISVFAVLIDGIEARRALTFAAVRSTPSLVTVASIILSGIPRVFVGDNVTVEKVINVSICGGTRSVLRLSFPPFHGGFYLDWDDVVLVELSGHSAGVHLRELCVGLADTMSIAVIDTLCPLASTASVAIMACAGSGFAIASSHVGALASFDVLCNSTLGLSDVTPGCSAWAGHHRAISSGPLSEQLTCLLCVFVCGDDLTVGVRRRFFYDFVAIIVLELSEMALANKAGVAFSVTTASIWATLRIDVDGESGEHEKG